ncbi:hypothetical protein [Paraliobacillus ryukyuensis]|uniref:hypothetical protein n=1 Tax=Paraliobacillus ryukyuensis TaxID=200904 RepID=UPI0009A7C6B5|nr:hypothetical protein [Paraliobacillus ryukyuensis]
MNAEDLKKLFLEMLDVDGKRGRKWFFPQNVDSQYKIFGSITLKELLVLVIPAFIVSIIIGAIPPYSSWVFWIIKSLFIVAIIIIPVVFVNYRPVKHRNNIRAKDHLKELLEYRKKKKTYFVRPKNKIID